MRVWMPNPGHPSPAEVKSWVWYHAFIIPGLGEAEASRSQGSLANQLSLSTDKRNTVSKQQGRHPLRNGNQGQPPASNFMCTRHRSTHTRAHAYECTNKKVIYMVLNELTCGSLGRRLSEPA